MRLPLHLSTQHGEEGPFLRQGLVCGKDEKDPMYGMGLITSCRLAKNGGRFDVLRRVDVTNSSFFPSAEAHPLHNLSMFVVCILRVCAYAGGRCGLPNTRADDV